MCFHQATSSRRTACPRETHLTGKGYGCHTAASKSALGHGDRKDGVRRESSVDAEDTRARLEEGQETCAVSEQLLARYVLVTEGRMVPSQWGAFQVPS